MPQRILTSVDLPAPFSPISAGHLARIQIEIGIAQRVRAAEGFLHLRQRQDGLRRCLLDRRRHQKIAANCSTLLWS